MPKLHVITIDIKKLEDAFNVKIKRNSQVLGLDCASKTGYATIKTNKKTAYISAGFVEISSKERYAKYIEFIKTFNRLIDDKKQTVIVEDTYLNKRFGNVWMFKMITFIGAIAYTIAVLKGCKTRLSLASHARKKLGLKGTAKKAELVDAINKLLKTKLTNDDEVDSIILAIGGILEE